jgi:hypothetical protein
MIHAYIFIKNEMPMKFGYLGWYHNNRKLKVPEKPRKFINILHMLS